MSYCKKFIQAAQNHKQATWELKVALWEARKYERVPWAELHARAGVTRQTANNWYDEVNQMMNTEDQPAPHLVTVDVNRLDDAAREAVLKTIEGIGRGEAVSCSYQQSRCIIKPRYGG